MMWLVHSNLTTLFPYETLSRIRANTLESPSPTNVVYCRLCIFSLLLKPSTIISASIEDDEVFQFLKQLCAPASTPRLNATQQILQYLLRTPINKIFFVSLPMIHACHKEISLIKIDKVYIILLTTPKAAL